MAPVAGVEPASHRTSLVFRLALAGFTVEGAIPVGQPPLLRARRPRILPGLSPGSEPSLGFGQVVTVSGLQQPSPPWFGLTTSGSYSSVGRSLAWGASLRLLQAADVETTCEPRLQ